MNQIETTSIPYWRKLLAVFLALIATIMLIFSTSTFAIKDAFSKKSTQDILKQVNLVEEYGDFVKDIVNVGIMHLTDSAYTDHLYLTTEQLPQFFEEKKIRSFMAEKLSAFAKVLLTEKNAYLEASDIADFCSSIPEHIEKETGKHISKEEIVQEVEKAIGGSRVEATIKTKIINQTGAIICEIIGILLLIAAFLLGINDDLLWDDLIFSGAIVFVSVFLIAASLFVESRLVGTFKMLGTLSEAIGSNVAMLWVRHTQELFANRGKLILLGLILPTLLIIICLFDKNYVRGIVKRKY